MARRHQVLDIIDINSHYGGLPPASEVSDQFSARNFYPSWSRELSTRFGGANPPIL
jgi:hypothetical protein